MLSKKERKKKDAVVWTSRERGWKRQRDTFTSLNTAGARGRNERSQEALYTIRLCLSIYLSSVSSSYLSKNLALHLSSYLTTEMTWHSGDPMYTRTEREAHHLLTESSIAGFSSFSSDRTLQISVSTPVCWSIITRPLSLSIYLTFISLLLYP